MNNESELILYNTLTNREELFTARKKGRVKIFTCGPSVYQKPHIGNYRTYIFEDLLLKYLKYIGYTVERAINFTNLEDKSIESADRIGKSIYEITQPHIDEFRTRAGELGITLPDEIPSSTDSVTEAAEVIKVLMDKGAAYRYNGNIYFDPLKAHDFGKIFGLDMSRWPEKKVRFSKDTYRGNRWNLGDFILWHGAQDNEEQAWETDFGRGRPSWNVQDAAVIYKILGNEIDIHMGGIDNIYRHHDYNRAIMESFSGSVLAPYWIHCEHLIVDGEKMSKSKGNTLYPEDAMDWGCSPNEVRYMLMSEHYRRKLNVTKEFIEDCCTKFSRLQERVALITGSTGKGNSPEIRRLIQEIPVLFRTKMNDNLQVPEAVAALYHVVEDLFSIQEREGISEELQAEIKKELKKIDAVLGILFPEN